MMPRFAILICLVLCSLSRAQSLAAASGPPETSLAGIELGHSTIADIGKMYGKPNVIQSSGSITLFQWQRLTVTLTVATTYDANNPANSDAKPVSIAIQGEGDPEKRGISRTGRGLRLGAKDSDVKKIYGIDVKKGSNTLTWSGERSLTIRMNDSGRVDRIELTSSGDSVH
jgi:hypothetical protein